MSDKTELAVLAGGCFWCTEAVFQRVKGVIAVKPGYAGGTSTNPTYEEVCSGKTGHAEVVQVQFDPSVLTFETLLHIFFDVHDPTTLNRQGNDVGSQYRSSIFTTSDKQKEIAEKVIQELTTNQVYLRKIVTEIKSLDVFYPAESYHSNYYNKNSYVPYCDLIISPKIKHFQEKYKALLKEE